MGCNSKALVGRHGGVTGVNSRGVAEKTVGLGRTAVVLQRAQVCALADDVAVDAIDIAAVILGLN